jgi:hypothetical protein
MAEKPTTAGEPEDRKEWLQPATRILVRRRQRLGHWYYVLRPLAIVYAILFRALREVLAVVIWVGLWAAWLLQKILALLLEIPIWLLVAYVRLRHGREAAEEVRRSMAASEAAGRAWRRRADARLARRVGRPSESADEAAGRSSDRSP